MTGLLCILQRQTVMHVTVLAMTFLMVITIETGYERIVELLIRKGADVNSIMNRGWTPIFFAVSEGTQTNFSMKS